MPPRPIKPGVGESGHGIRNASLALLQVLLTASVLTRTWEGLAGRLQEEQKAQGKVLLAGTCCPGLQQGTGKGHFLYQPGLHDRDPRWQVR